MLWGVIDTRNTSKMWLLPVLPVGIERQILAGTSVSDHKPERFGSSSDVIRRLLIGCSYSGACAGIHGSSKCFTVLMV